jgi:hypothetical protein
MASLARAILLASALPLASLVSAQSLVVDGEVLGEVSHEQTP